MDADIVFDHNPYDHSGDRYEVLDRSSNASVGRGNRDHSGKKVSKAYMSQLRSLNHSEKRSRPYNPDQNRERRFNENILPHIQQLRSTAGDDAMLVSFRELYDAMVGQSELFNKKRLKSTNALHTSHDKRLINRVAASVIVHEMERDSRPLSQKLEDSNSHKYATSKNSQSEDFTSIMLKIKTGWSEWTDFPIESISTFARSLLRFINTLYNASKGGDIVIRRKRGIVERDRQLKTMLNIVCKATPGIPNKIQEPVLKSLLAVLGDATDPAYERYPMIDTAPNFLITCQIELVLGVLQYLYPESKMKHSKVVRALKESSYLNLSSISCKSRSYAKFAAKIISKLEALS